MRLTMSVYARKNLGQLFSLTSLNLVNKKWTISIMALAQYTGSLW